MPLSILHDAGPRGLFRIIFISHLSKECKIAQDVKFARIADE